MRELFAFLVGGLMVVFGWTVVVPRHWRGDREHDQMFAAWLPVSAGTKRGVTRSIPVIFFSFTCVVGSVICHATAMSLLGRVPIGLFGVVLSVACVGLFGMFVLWPSVVLFNRPSFVVAPHYRSDQGAIEIWRADRRKRDRKKPESNDE